MLLSAANAPGSLVPNVKYALIADPKGPNPRGHRFSDSQQPLADTIAEWLQDK
jgi:hypothetical protein